MCDIDIRSQAGRSPKSRMRAVGAIFALWGTLAAGCASTQRQVKDPDEDATCQAADGEGVVLVRCGRFALAVVDVDPALPQASVVDVYREVVANEVGVEVLVEDAPLSVAGVVFTGFRWETPDQVAPRSGHVLTGDLRGERKVITCAVRDAGRTAQERCEARLTALIRSGTDGLPKVSMDELSAPAAGAAAGAAADPTEPIETSPTND